MNTHYKLWILSLGLLPVNGENYDKEGNHRNISWGLWLNRAISQILEPRPQKLVLNMTHLELREHLILELCQDQRKISISSLTTLLKVC